MAKNNGNTGIDGVEQVNTQKPKKTDESMTTRAIRDFIEHKLLGDDGGKNFNEITSNKGNGLSEDFLKFLAKKPEFDEQSNEQIESFKSVKNVQFLRETLRIGVGFETKQEALKKIIFDEYEGLDNAMKKDFDNRVDTMSLANLTYYLRNSSERHKFVKLTLPNTPLKKKDFLAFLDSLEIDGTKLTEEQKHSFLFIQGLNHVDEKDIENLLLLFPENNLEQKQLLIRAFLPTVSLGDLVRMRIITESEARRVVKEKLDTKGVFKDIENIDTEIEAFIERVDLDEVIIPTKLFPEEVVNKILSTEGVKKIKQELNELFDELKQDVRDEFGLTSDKEGKYLPSLIKKIQKEIIGKNGKCLVENVKNLGEGTIIHGQIQEGSEIRNIYIRIDAINTNSAHETGKKTMTITHLTGPKGTVIQNPSATKTEPTVSFQDFFSLLRVFNKSEILDVKTFQDSINTGVIREVVEDGDIKTLSDLNNKLDTIDGQGNSFHFKAGKKTSFSIFTPTDPEFGIFSVQDIDESSHTLKVNTGTKIEGPYTFDEFFFFFKEQKGARMHGLENLETTLQLIKNKAGGAKNYKDIEYKDGKLIPSDRKDDKNFEGIKYFVGKNGEVIEIVKAENNRVQIAFHDGYKEKKEKDKNGNEIKSYETKTRTNPLWYGWEIFYMKHEELSAEPKIFQAPIEPEEVKESPDKMKHGFLKHYLGNSSLHDIFGAGKQIVDFVKHKLEHNSKMNAAKLALSLGKTMGFSDEWLMDLRGSVHASNKKLTDELVDELGKLPTPMRHKRTRDILNNHGSHDYEIHAAMISMLKKHGGLYAGGLKDLEGTYAWYKALGGKPNDTFMMKTKENLTRKNEPFREETLLREWLKHLGSEKGGYRVDGNLWIQAFKIAWQEGIEGEAKKGESETAEMQFIDARMDYVFDKWNGKEYANGVGALRKVWSKGGTPEQMQEGAFLLAITDIPEHLAQGQINGLKNEFYGGHTYPGLLFIGSPQDQKIFRRVVEKLVDSDSDMKIAYAEIKKLLENDPKKKLVETTKNFWRKYGHILAPKLAMTKDPEIFDKKEEDEDFKAYSEKLSGNLADVGKIDSGEKENHMYDYNHTSFALANMKRYVDEMDVNSGNGNMNNEKEKYFFEQLIKGIDDIKNQKRHLNPINDQEKNENIKLQKKIYREYHKNILARLSDRLNGDAFEKLETQPYMKRLMRLGFTKPSSNEETELIGSVYDMHLERDFNKYINSNSTIEEAEDKTLDSLEKILKIHNQD
ncbi:hypothetical protein GW819_01425 [Candidatus Gracilibacteria bacterium]|nr:hypothetical protein [Candidatus Gracilibacteria bacterium]OIO75705.1 MAG: hypothetical protein AUJ87_04300 [Candidatus Gracilibacteria bacterium CG1_02_38_174]PIQ40961.1 MAG: hypothetical protein COW06_04535 [Candidatus Gracilibacteria bacterium CG12_big_fil_rev_8_21_14_0_65_38_15]PIZ01994.1 MAG: hypothetical protein COY60_00750 [Candidatus Gracilibacteria bacterium CG_4_10_14_0_8_um_filter_38_28]